jgi:hypothetical protein
LPGEFNIAADQITANRAGRGYLLSAIVGSFSAPSHVGHFGVSDWQPPAKESSASTIVS